MAVVMVSLLIFSGQLFLDEPDVIYSVADSPIIAEQSVCPPKIIWACHY